MSEPYLPDQLDSLEPVHEPAGEAAGARWTGRLIVFLRVMAVASLIKGLYHWSRVTGIGIDDGQPFELHSIAWQTATVFFAVIDLVAAVGLWLAAAWGAVIWLMAVCSMLAVEMFFPQVFGAALWVGLIEAGLLVAYLVLALKSAQEHPQ